jgi:parallel beta-helix repeat protein
MLASSSLHARLHLGEPSILNSLHVHNLDTGLSYATIQDAIDAVETLNKDRILVDSGIYYENVIVSKGLTLIGESEETTIVDGMGVGTIMELSTNNTKLTGFTLRNSGQGWAQSGISLDHVSNCSISDNNITSDYCGAWLESSTDNIISNNNFVNDGYAIALYSFSNHNSIIENNVTASGHAGILFASSMENNLSRNSITSNEYGIELVSSSNNTITENDIASNSHGIALYESSNTNDLIRNNIRRNGYGIEMDTSVDDRIYHNNFIDNAPQVFLYDLGYSNLWDSGYPEGGNYWSDYNNEDSRGGFYQNETGSDGIADAPYLINSDNEDHYPLMGIFCSFVVQLPPYPTGDTEHVNVVSNSTVSGFNYLAWLSSPNQYFQPGQFLIQFYATEENGTIGFCLLMIPKTVLNATWYTVLVDWNPVNVSELKTPSTTKVYLYFTYVNSEHQIVATVPEFQLAIFLLTVMVATWMSAIRFRKKRREE